MKNYILTILALYASRTVCAEGPEMGQFVQINQAAETPCPEKPGECKPIGSVRMSVDVAWKGETRDFPTCDGVCYGMEGIWKYGISSIQPSEGLKCDLFGDLQCQDRIFAGMSSGGSSNLYNE
ncbi:hypothetical protein ANOM_000786, partial [Aspergillus nomiae NRRL 13137]